MSAKRVVAPATGLQRYVVFQDRPGGRRLARAHHVWAASPDEAVQKLHRMLGKIAALWVLHAEEE